MLVAESCDARHVDFVDGCDVCGSASRQDHVLGDLLTHHAHWLDAIANLRFGWRRRGGLVRWGRCDRGRSSRSRSRSGFDETENVVLGYATT